MTFPSNTTHRSLDSGKTGVHGRTPASHLFLAPDRLGFSRDGHIRERHVDGMRLLEGELSRHNREFDGQSHRTKCRTTDDPHGSPDSSPSVSSTPRPASPWSGCTPAEPASAAPDRYENAATQSSSQTRTGDARGLADRIEESSRLNRSGLRPNPSSMDGHFSDLLQLSPATERAGPQL